MDDGGGLNNTRNQTYTIFRFTKQEIIRVVCRVVFIIFISFAVSFLTAVSMNSAKQDQIQQKLASSSNVQTLDGLKGETAYKCPDVYKGQTDKKIAKSTDYNKEKGSKGDKGERGEKGRKGDKEKKKRVDAWMGLHDITREGHFMWVLDGSTATFFDWSGVGNPDNSGNNEDCVHFASLDRFQWNDIDCGRNMAYVCEKLGDR